MCRQHGEDLRTRAEAQLQSEEQHAALMAATSAQHASQLQALQDKHAAKQQESARCAAAHEYPRCAVPPSIVSAQDDSYLAVIHAK